MTSFLFGIIEYEHFTDTLCLHEYRHFKSPTEEIKWNSTE